MAELSPKLMPKEYTPGGTYNFIYSIQTQVPKWNPFEHQVLLSNGYDDSYPSTYCNNTVFGGSETAVTRTIKYAGESYAYPMMNDPKIYQDSEVDLGYPLQAMYNGGATKFTSNAIFGQSAGEDYPATVVIERNSDPKTTSIKWYKNNVLVATDTINRWISDCFALALVSSGATITSYAYIFVPRNSEYIWTSGQKSNADVLTILNDGGYAGSNEDVYGFTDEELGDFVLSHIYGWDLYAHTYYAVNNGYACNSKSTIELTNDDLDERLAESGGYRGTDLIEYMTGKSGQAGWDILMSAEGDGKSCTIPGVGGVEYTIKFHHSYGGNSYEFVVYDNNDVAKGFHTTNATCRKDGGCIYLTWYRQTNPIENAEDLLWVQLEPYTNFIYTIKKFLQSDSVVPDYETFDNWGLLMDMIDGYDPNGGQEDDPQDEPEDVDDPTYDPLGSGFLYAFMVDSTDMTNLADALVPETLAQKIRADFGNNLFEFIVSYHMMPCLTNASSLNKMNIAYRGNAFTYGDNNTQLALAPITKSFYTVSCGSRVCMPTGARKDGFENWAQANVQLYLPFIGYVHLNTADVWNKTITISYKFDILQGTCVANVGVGSNGTIYSFEGSCKYNIPFTTAIDKSNTALLSGIMSSVSVVGAVGGAVAGGSPMSLLGAVGSVADATGGFMSALEHKSIINRGGCLSGAPGWLMPRKPALIITVPNRIQPGMIYNDTNGYPVFETGYLNGYENNYVEVGQIGLKAITNQYGATPNDSELDMIKTTLKGGVYV